MTVDVSTCQLGDNYYSNLAIFDQIQLRCIFFVSFQVGVVENQISGKQIPLKNQISSKEPKMCEYEKGKEVRTYADIVSVETFTD